MQALIDFDGWRKWKEYAKAKEDIDPAQKAAQDKEEKAKAKAALKAMFARPPPSGPSAGPASANKGKSEDEKKEGQANGAVRKPSVGGRSHKSSRSSGSGGGVGMSALKTVEEGEGTSR